MSDLGRRGFLQGLIASIGAGSVILEASADDIKQYGTKVGDSALVQPGKIAPIEKPKWGTDYEPAVRQGAMAGGMWLLYNAHGQAVCAVRNFAPNGLLTADIDCVPLGEDGFRWFQNGLQREWELRAKGRK